MSSVPDIFVRAVAEFDSKLQNVGSDDWSNETPCPGWDVRTLVNHIVDEDLWVPPLLDGKTIADVGDSISGDHLGDDPLGAWERASKGALEAARAPGAMETTTHLSFGDLPGAEYSKQVLCDHIVHAWDLARGIGADDRLDPDLVDFAYGFYEPQAEAWRAAGAFGPAVEVPGDADAQTRLLGLVGRRR